MRRKDREMNRDFAMQVIDNAPYAVLSVTDMDGEPYAVPLSIVRDGDFLYFHSAKSGTKVDLLAVRQNVCLTFVGEVNIPNLFTYAEYEELKKDKQKSSQLTSKVFTTEFESAIVFGKVLSIQNVNEKREALRMICEKYTPDKMMLFDAAIQSGMDRTHIYRVFIDTVTAKRKKFDTLGEEMKWGRT